MGENSKIEWTDATWPIVQGCDPVSQGCVNCYAVPLLWRMSHNPNPKISGPLQGVVEEHNSRGTGDILRFTGKVALREDRLDWPLQWKQPRMIFVPSHGDIFHKGVPDEFLDKIFARMALASHHTLQVLTKRGDRMRAYLTTPTRRNSVELAAEQVRASVGKPWSPKHCFPWPLPNVWLGVSCEDQATADERIPALLDTPAAVRFISAEPLLGRISLKRINTHGGWYDALEGWRDVRQSPAPEGVLDWVIVGGESGPNARPMHPDWARSLRDQCADAGVAFFFKQWGAWAHEGQCESNGRRIIWPHDCESSNKIGKKRAGRLLDGVEHNGFPA